MAQSLCSTGGVQEGATAGTHLQSSELPASQPGLPARMDVFNYSQETGRKKIKKEIKGQRVLSPALEKNLRTVSSSAELACVSLNMWVSCQLLCWKGQPCVFSRESCTRHWHILLWASLLLHSPSFHPSVQTLQPALLQRSPVQPKGAAGLQRVQSMG